MKVPQPEKHSILHSDPNPKPLVDVLFEPGPKRECSFHTPLIEEGTGAGMHERDCLFPILLRKLDDELSAEVAQIRLAHALLERPFDTEAASGEPARPYSPHAVRRGSPAGRQESRTSHQTGDFPNRLPLTRNTARGLSVSWGGRKQDHAYRD